MELLSILEKIVKRKRKVKKIQEIKIKKTKYHSSSNLRNCYQYNSTLLSTEKLQIFNIFV